MINDTTNPSQPQDTKSTLAPTEKHLEDWIVSYMSDIPSDPKKCPLDQVTMLGRQVSLPSGIADVIGYLPALGVIVHELKRGKIDGRALAQILRYMRDLACISRIALGLIRDPREFELTLADPDIKGTLIGHSIEDENIIIAAEMANVRIITYKYDADNDTYELTPHHPPTINPLEYYQYSRGALAQYFQQAFVNNIDFAIEEPDMFHGVLAAQKGYEIFILNTKHGVPVPYIIENEDEE